MTNFIYISPLTELSTLRRVSDTERHSGMSGLVVNLRVCLEFDWAHLDRLEHGYGSRNEVLEDGVTLGVHIRLRVLERFEHNAISVRQLHDSILRLFLVLDWLDIWTNGVSLHLSSACQLGSSGADLVLRMSCGNESLGLHQN